MVGCGGGRDHAAEVAAAKCETALHDALHLSQFETNPSVSHVTVTRLGASKRRVLGDFTNADTPARTFVCEVVPDSSDALRGLRVTLLEMGAPGSGS